MPQIVASPEPSRFVGLTAADREDYEQYRTERNENREQFIDRAKDEVRPPIARCVVQTLIIFSPVCLLIVPAAYGAERTAVGVKAGRAQPYMDPLPSDDELSRVHGSIQVELASAKLANHMLATLKLAPTSTLEDRYPRLTVRAESVAFTKEKILTIVMVAQGEPAPGIAWKTTAHRYHFGYYGYARRFHSQLVNAQASLAQSIVSTYGLGSFAPEAIATPRPERVVYQCGAE